MTDHSKVPPMTNIENEALAIAEVGIRVFPCRPLDKRPAVNDWPNVATVDPAQIAEWFARPANLGLRCGMTDGGVNIFVVDIDIKNDQPGERSWADFCDEHPEVREVAELTVSVSTPSGGWHFYFAAPGGERCPRNSNPWPGVDIRGEGGYVLAPPSTLANGEYAWVRDLWAPNEGLMYAPAALMAALNGPEPIAEVIELHATRSQVTATQLNSTATYTDDESPIEFMKREFSVYDWLLRHGWQGGSRRGQQEEVTRPGKSRREGTSATVHHDSNIVNVHTSTIPPEFMNVGRPTANGGFTINGFDAWMIENGILDEREAMSAIRKTRMPQAPRPTPAVVPVTIAAEPARTVDDGPRAGLNLPSEFWEKRPWLAHIRDAAWSRGMSADAVLGAVLSRYATAVPPQYLIPPIRGAHSTFDHLSILVAESASGKSASMTIARELWEGPTARKDIVWDFPTPSGEGLVQAFFEMVTEDDGGKKKQVNRKTKTAVHFSVDEAMALIESGSRQGATIGSVITAAWTGGNPGQGNASADRQRVGMNPGTFRMSGLAAIQTSLGAAFMDDKYVRQGLSGRLIFFHATDPGLPDWREAPEWPGALDLPVHPTLTKVIEYPVEVHETIKNAFQARQRGEVVVPPIDGHLDLVRLKLSGLVALMDGRTSVVMSDWILAAEIVEVHLRLRSTLMAVQQQQQRDEGHKRATAAALFEDTKDDLRERRGIASLRDAIPGKVPDEGIGRNELRRKMVKSTTKHRFDPALEAAIADGKVVVREGRIHRV